MEQINVSSTTLQDREEEIQPSPKSAKSFYITQENYTLMYELFKAMGISSLEQNQKASLKACVNRYFEDVAGIMGSAFEVVKFSEKDIDRSIKQRINQELAQNPDYSVVCADRFLLRGNVPFQVHKIGISRQSDGTKGPRQGNPPIEVQLQNLKDQIGTNKILLVDDGLFTGGTMSFIIQKMFEAGMNVKKVIAFLRNPGITHLNTSHPEVPVEAVYVLDKNYKDWADLRDLGILGGKVDSVRQSIRTSAEAATDNLVEVQVSRPYIAPFSDGENLSLNTSPEFLKISQRLLNAQDNLLKHVQEIAGRKITVADVWRASLQIPYSDKIEITLDTPIEDISAQAAVLISKVLEDLDGKPERLVMDMDGTLYQLDGVDNGFKKSTLSKIVQDNGQKLIMCRENCEPEKAREIWEGAVAHGNPSIILGQKYGLTREQFFEEVWGPIEVEKVIRNWKGNDIVLKELSKSGISLSMVSMAPRVWVEKVLGHMGVMDLFDDILCGGDFIQKIEAFEELARKYNIPGEKIWSVGDQPETDLKPALAAGFGKGVQIGKDLPLQYLLHIVKNRNGQLS